jgi:group I intron endonuclease
MIVYKITNQINSMVYIGVTRKTVAQRWSAHINVMRGKNQRLLYVAMREHGHENFSIEQIAVAQSLEELGSLEAQYIKELNCYIPNGYNMTSGGFGSMGYSMTEEVRQKIIDGRRKNPPVFSAESRARLSAAAIGRVIPREAVERQLAKRRGAKRTPEQCLAISSGRVGKGLKNDAARKHPKENILLALALIKENKKQPEIKEITGLSQSYISRLKNNHRGLSLQGA